MAASETRPGGGGRPLRVLVVGWVNAPHVRLWLQTLVELGHEVHVVGRSAAAWPEHEPVPGVASVTTLAATGPPVWRGLALSRRLRAAAREVRPDVVHAHWLPEAGWMAAREGLRPLITSAWGSDVLGAGWLARRRSRTAIRASTVVLADSVPLGDAVAELAGRRVRVEIVRWGLDLERFRPAENGPAADRAALGWPDAPTILSTRALGPVYNVPVLLEAVARVRREVPDARLVLKHPGTAVPEAVQSAIDRLGLQEAVSVLGHVPPDDLPAIYRAADVAVSIPSSDSSPRSAWEALACGVPLVVSDLPWARAELAPGDEALLAPADAGAVAGALLSVLRDGALARRLAAGARAAAERTVDPDVQRALVERVYRDVAGG